MLIDLAQDHRSLSFVPKKGCRIFSVNLKMVDVGELWRIAKKIGFQPELIHLRYAEETPQVHALLWEGAIVDQPSNLEDQYDAVDHGSDSGNPTY